MITFFKKAFTSFGFYLVVICITVATLAAVIFFEHVFSDVEEKVPANPAPFQLRSGFADEIHNFNFDIILSYHGQIEEIEVSNYTVAQLLEKEDIVLGEQDVINLDLQTELDFQMLIQIDDVRFETEYEEVVMPFNRVAKTKSGQHISSQVTITKGESGLRKDTYSTKFVNGIFAERELISQEVIKEPVDEVITCGLPSEVDTITIINTAGAGLGTANGTSSGGTFIAPDGTEYKYLYYVDVSATAYGDMVGSITYTGRHVELGIIAVDPNVIPLHSKVYVIGDYGDYGVCDAQDIGGGVKGNRIDVYLQNEDVCRQFGVRQMRAYVLDESE